MTFLEGNVKKLNGSKSVNEEKERERWGPPTREKRGKEAINGRMHRTL